MLYLKWCGAALLLLFALFCGREYSAYAERRVGECEGYISLLLHIEKMIDSYLAPPSVIFRDFECEALESIGFLPAVRSGEAASNALSLSEKNSLLPEHIREKIREYFDGFGRGYKDAELTRTRASRAELEEMLKSEKASLEKSVKVTRALLLGAAAGITILII